MDTGQFITHRQTATNRLARLVLRHTLTSSDAPSTSAVVCVPYTSMRLRDRDHLVLVVLSRFTQLSTPQINALVFHEATSRFPCDKVLRRLRESGMIETVDQPNVGGRRGGRSETIYQLGKHGYPMFFTGKRKIQRVIRYHALAVADVYVQVKQAEQDGWLGVLDWQVEADAWVNVAGADIRPDLYLEVDHLESKIKYYYWCEIDLGGERQRQIIEKLERYIYAYEHSDDYPHPVFPQVVWLVTSPERERELKQIISRMKNPPDRLFIVAQLDSFPQLLQG